MTQKIVCSILVLVILLTTAVVEAGISQNSYWNEARYLDTDKYGTFVIRTNKMYQTGTEKLVLDLGDGTTALNNRTGKTIENWRSFYVTDVTARYFHSDQISNNADGNIGISDECILVSGLVLVTDPNNKSQGIPADVFLLYYPITGQLKTLHINFRYPISISQNQYDMKEGSWFEYLDSGILFPRGIITQDGTGRVFVLSGAANLNMFNSAKFNKMVITPITLSWWKLLVLTQKQQLHKYTAASTDPYKYSGKSVTRISEHLSMPIRHISSTLA